jgi:hypothetical protein
MTIQLLQATTRPVKEEAYCAKAEAAASRSSSSWLSEWCSGQIYEECGRCTDIGFAEVWDADVILDYISGSSLAGIEKPKNSGVIIMNIDG